MNTVVLTPEGTAADRAGKVLRDKMLIEGFQRSVNPRALTARVMHKITVKLSLFGTGEIGTVSAQRADIMVG